MYCSMIYKGDDGKKAGKSPIQSKILFVRRDMGE